VTNLAASTVISYLPHDVQLVLVEQVREVMAASPLVRPHTPGGTPMRVRVTSAGSLGWVGDGAYRYSPTDSRGNPWPEMPALWREIADTTIAGDPRHDGRPVAWDSAIVNWYDPGASLGMHQDLGEADRTLPIVTISLGDAASWVVVEADERGQVPERGKRHRVRIESGAVTVLSGPLRLAGHSIERIIPAPMFSPILDKRGQVVPGRISITIRQAGPS
jgi:alkylated DNA repair protein (DNA oxidative demethylase)